MSTSPMPDPMVQSDNPAPAPQPQQAAPPAAPSMWKNVLMGALTGLQGHGILGAVEGATHPDQMAVQRQQKRDLNTAKVQQAQGAVTEQQSKIKFQDAQSANAVAEAARNNALAAALPQEARDAHLKSNLDMMNSMQQLGISPVIMADDTHEGAKGAMEALTDSRGAVPHLFTLEVNGQHLGYDLTQLSGTPQGLQVINSARAVQGQDAINPAAWRQQPPAARAQVAENALKFFAPDAPANAQAAESKRLQYKGWLDAYKKRPDADPQTLQKMQTTVDNLTAVSAGLTKHEKEMKAADAYANAAAQKQARLDVDQSAYQNQLASGDVTGWQPKPGAIMSEQQFNAANSKFASGTLSKAQDTEKSFQMFQDAYANRNDAKTGAQSMLALSQHLATTFGNVKGARITKDMIQEHLGARNVSDKATVAVQKLTNGDVLSPDQWDAFKELITDSRNRQWDNTVKMAHSMGVPFTSDMAPQGGLPGKSSSNKYSNLGAVPLR